MRVETKPALQQGMVKKKHRLRKQQRDANEFPDSSDEGGAEGPFCHHIHKSVNFSLVKKAIKNHGITGECMVCKTESGNDRIKNSTDQEQNDEADTVEDSIEPTIWLCLQCGNQGCDRNSKEKHALKHYETPRSASHDLCINLTTYVIWCYSCDSEVGLEVSKKLTECVEFVRKQVGVPPSVQQHSVKKGSFPEDASQEKDIKEDKQNADKQNKSKTGTSQTPALLGLPKVKGLSNLGNTCFFNAVMQNISQTPIFVTILNERVQKGFSMQLSAQPICCDTDSDESAHNSGEEDKEPKALELSAMNITLGDGGVLTASMLSFMKDMHNSTSKGPVVTPSTLFGQVCKKAPRFKGFQQQDSHELLRYLLDCMKAEEVKRSQAGILSAFSLPTNTNYRTVDEETKAKVKGYGVQVKHTFIDSVFGGLFISTVQCEECSMPSQIFEPFLDVSLPVTEEKTIRPSNLSRKKADFNRDDKVQSNTEGPLYKAMPSKHMAKKERKKAKKDAKRRKKKPSESKEETVSTIVDGQAEQCKNGEDESGDEEEDEEKRKEDVMDVDKNDDLTRVPEFDSSCHHTTDAKNVDIGLSLQDLEQKDDNRDNDTDSNKAIGTNSEGNLSDSDADVEDNIDGNRSSPVDSTVQGSKDFIGENAINTEPLSIGDNNTKIQDKERTSHIDASLGKIIQNSGCFTNSSGDTMCSNFSSSVKIEDVCDNPVKDYKQINGIIPELTDCLKNINISNDNKNDVEIETINDKKALNAAEVSENMHKSSVCNRNLQNSSRPNTPQSPKLSRSSSLRMSSNTKSKYAQKIEAKQEALKILSPTRYQPDSHECSVQSCLNQFTAAELLTGSNKFGCENCSRRKNTGASKDGKKELVYTNASKQVLIFSPPAVLTLHMKRFQQVGYSLRKVNRHVDFPLVLDLAPYCSSLSMGVKPSQSKVLYSLYGIVEHSGRLTGGHYTAYVKVRPNACHNVKAFLQHNNLYDLKVEKVLSESLDAMRMGEGAVGGVQEDEVTPPTGKWYYISDSRVSETTENNVLRCQAYLLFYERIY